MKIILLVSNGDEELDASDQVLVPALIGAGFEVSIECWEEFVPKGGMQDTLLFFRSIVSAYKNLSQFQRFVAQLSKIKVCVANDLQSLVWNLDKKHLESLQGDGYFTPHTLVSNGTPQDIRIAVERSPSNLCVLKPRFGGNGNGVVRIDKVKAESQLRDLDLSHYDQGALVQEFIKEIESGEYSLVFINQQFSHSVLKLPKPEEFRVNSQFGPQPAALVKSVPLLVEAAKSLLSRIPGDPIITRVDCVLTQTKLCCIEIETIDPNLYFDLYPAAALTLANFLRERLKACESSR